VSPVCLSVSLSACMSVCYTITFESIDVKVHFSLYAVHILRGYG